MDRFYKVKMLPMRGILALITMMLMLIAANSTSAQDDYSKQRQRHQQNHYRAQDNLISRACHLLDRKRGHSPRKPAVRKSSTNNSGRVLTSCVALKKDPEPEPRQQSAPEQIVVSEQKLEQLHHAEDDVLAKNKLPVPNSKKHEDIRDRVAEDLKKNPVSEPRPLAPLYFQFNQDEFSVVDMEPFLIAVEYALQGRHVLIEGHTDSRGQDDFNVKLSVKRVQRIRQLMLDMGVPDSNISVAGYGEEHTKDKNQKNEDEHQIARRVDFTVF
jgi:outer membrane protein OmpA-like peptidoglycan-associated protein